MNKKIVVIIILSILILICSIFIFFMVKKDKVSNKDIIMNAKNIEIRFTYSSMIKPVVYEITINNDVATLETSSFDEIIDKRDLSREEVDIIKQALIEGDVISWDGFYKSDPDVLDGASFSLILKIDDRNISAHGDNSWPNNYHKFRDLFYKVVK